MIWDLEGKDDYQMVADTYLAGMSGYLLVADGTRKETLHSARDIQGAMGQLFPNAPSLLLLNKHDLAAPGHWKVRTTRIFLPGASGWS
jgi:GTPase SAR1 family protein